MDKLKQKLLLLIFLFGYLPASAQAEMADQMRSEGKIYVVVAIILIVLSGLIVYLFLMDRKVKKLEDLLREKQQTK